MKSILCIVSAPGPAPDFSFLGKFGYSVEYLADTTADLGQHFPAYNVIILACETRGTQHARIWWYEKEMFSYVRAGGRLLICAPGIAAWSMVWNAYPALLPVTPRKRSAALENFAQRFRWDESWEKSGKASRVVPTTHPVGQGITEWPEFYEGAKPGSFNAYDFDVWMPKPHTDVALFTEDGGVALAFMEMGQGRTAFLLADIHDDAGQAWETWGQREVFWGALLRHLDEGKLLIQRTPTGLQPFAARVNLVPRPPFEFRQSPPFGNKEWPRILTRTDWTMLADNQLAVNVSPTPITREPALFGDGWSRAPREELGIGQAKFYPTATQFDAALSLDFMVQGAVVEMQPIPGAYQWQPHLETNRFQSPDGTIIVEKRMAIGGDVATVELRLVSGSPDGVRLRGNTRYHGLLEPHDELLLGQLESGVMFGVAASAPVHWTVRENPIRYEAEIPFEGDLSVAFTAAMEIDLVKTRLRGAMANRGSVFAIAFQKWDDYFVRQVPAFRSEDPEIERMVYSAFLGFMINLYDIPYEPWRDPHSCPSKMHFDPQWEQDDVQSATIGKWLRDSSLIERQLLRPFRVGFVLNVNAAYGPVDRQTRGVISELQQYSIPLREVYLFNPRPELRAAMTTAMLHEEAENDAWTPVDAETGLFCIFNCLGMDDSPRWDMVSPGQKAEWFQSFDRGMITPDVNATMAHRAAFLAELLEASGDGRAEDFRALAARRKRLVREHLWSREVGFFVDRISGEPGASDVLTPMGLTPLLLGPFDEEVSAGVSKQLADPETFNTPYVLPTVAKSHPKFDPLSYWRGSIWSRTNWFPAEGLYAAGLKTEAAELTRRWVELAIKDGPDLRENYNPLTGEKKCVSMFTEGLAGVVDTYLKNVVGFHLTLKGFNLDPIALDQSTPSFTFGPFRYREREITIKWDRALGAGQLQIDGKVEGWQAGSFRSFELG